MRCKKTLVSLPMYPACKREGELTTEIRLVCGGNYSVLAWLQMARHTDLLGMSMRDESNHGRHDTGGQ